MGFINLEYLGKIQTAAKKTTKGASELLIAEGSGKIPKGR